MTPDSALKKIFAKTPIKKLVFDGITLDQCEPLLQIIKNGDELEELQLKDSHFRDYFMEELGTAIAENKNLLTFSFKECSFSEEGPSLFAKELTKNKSITNFKLNRCGNDEDNAKFIEGLYKHEKIEELILKSCSVVKDNTINALVYLIKKNSTIKRIYLKDSIIDADLQPLKEAYQAINRYIEWNFDGVKNISHKNAIFDEIKNLNPNNKTFSKSIQGGLSYFSSENNNKNSTDTKTSQPRNPPFITAK